MSGILLGTHGGAGADGAARVASLLARRLGVPLTVLAVQEPMPVADFGYGIVYVPTPEEDAAVRRDLLMCAQAQLDRCGITGVVPRVRMGGVVSAIAATASTLDADIIVTGLGPHDLADRVLGGETALHLAQSATTPVLAVPANATGIPGRVVASTDLSPTSRQAARVAAKWLQAGDELHLVHVTDRTKGGARDQVSETPPAERSSVASQLACVVTELGLAPGVVVEKVELFGDPARTLLACAQHVDADLITLGSHGYGPLKRLFLGSVASKVIRLATTAVLVAPVGCAQR